MDESKDGGGLEALLRRGPTPRYMIRARVLAHWAEIEAARKLPCTWGEIAVALGLSEDHWRSVFRAFHKIRRDYGGPPPKAGHRPVEKAAAEKVTVIPGKNIKLDMQ